MKTEIRVVPHHMVPGANVIELWYDGEFVGEITGADGRGVRVISKYLRPDEACGSRYIPSALDIKRVDPLIVEVRF
jgi:hypothetical protein